jgi:pyruvate dehydrogenase E2 component (dihydrolipoamide acetyltransferase)
MAEIVKMPRLSDTMTEGVVAQWHKKVGDKISEGDLLADIETDKATMEFESFQEGVLLYIGVNEGETAPVESILAILGQEGEDVNEILKNEASSGSVSTSVEQVEDTPAEVAQQEEASADVSYVIPEGVEVVTMPRLSDTMTEGVVAQWHKSIGDSVSEGDILAEIETDKATMEFESFQEGTLLYIGVEKGQSAEIDAILAILGPAGTDVEAVLKGFNSKTSSSSSSEAKAETKDASAPIKEEKVEAVEQSSFVEEDLGNGERIFVSPLAKKLAEDKGINLRRVKGSGEQGRIVKRDIDNYVEPVVTSPSSAAASDNTPAFEDVKVSQMRKTIAKRLTESKNGAPHYYLTIEIDMDNAIESRKAINAMPDTKVSFNDMVIKAAAMALKKHPKVNTSWQGDTIRFNNNINIGVAIAVEDGLLVPVIRNTDSQQLTQISSQVKAFAQRAKAKKLMPEDWAGSTFTISNLGMFGIEEFTSIINQPDSSILSIGAIVQKPVVKNGQIVVGNTMKVTMANDHRTVDGATGAEFLQTFKAYLENPVTMIA